MSLHSPGATEYSTADRCMEEELTMRALTLARPGLPPDQRVLGCYVEETQTMAAGTTDHRGAHASVRSAGPTAGVPKPRKSLTYCGSPVAPALLLLCAIETRREEEEPCTSES
jgi:hypothetical protein